MTNNRRSPVARYLRRMLSSDAAGGLSDAQLLERFVDRRDEAAFEVLVWRHGPKVLGVCRRVLRHEQDAEDAFQATFLVLARKAGSIGRGQALAAWLYRVAYRVALRAQAMARRQAERTRRVEAMAMTKQDATWEHDELHAVLDEEIDRLPEKYRAPFILCYLDGKTNVEAARALGCPVGTVQSRLAWARERLRCRLTRRGLGLFGAGLTVAMDAAPVPAAIVDATVGAATVIAAGAPGSTVVAASVLALSQGVLPTMYWSKVMSVSACLLALGALGVGGTWSWTAREARAMAAAVPVVVARADQPPAQGGRAEEPQLNEKTYELEMRDQPWPVVLNWLSDQAQVPLDPASLKPVGKFTFIGLRKGAEYSIPEIIDILNEGLASQQLLLLRHRKRVAIKRGEATFISAESFTILRANEKLDPADVPRIQADELPKRGKTEPVSIRLDLTNLKAADVGAVIKKMLGPLGEVIVQEKSNRVIIQDMADNVNRIYVTIRKIEKRAPPQ